ncbi:ABC transporter ATP-binding protein [Streptococcus agalactiae]
MLEPYEGKLSRTVLREEGGSNTTNLLDYELQMAFTQLIKNKTVIMIAHRLSAIKNMDEIIVVENGQIIERGSSKLLLEDKSSKYSYFMNMYIRANDWMMSNEV